MQIYEKIIEELKKIGNIQFSDFTKPLITVDDAIKIVKQESEQHNNGWIPVSEKLPEESLNSVIGWDEYRERCCFVQYVNGKFVIGNDIDSVKITAWMPLPEPYHLPVCADTDCPYNSDNGCPAIECGWRLRRK